MNKRRTKKNLKIVKNQIQEINQMIEEILGKKIEKELWDLINSLIIKVNQNYKLSMDVTRMDLETKVKPIIDKYNEETGKK
ncbi:MAG: hypothetical protein HN982_07925 [Candidatus Marinimicrobia bacterium]|nr:hypothetical protein [Candidatus Neomarinimicrobiota bacterium]